MLHKHGEDVAFEVIDGEEGFAQGEGEGFGTGDADKQSTGEPGAGGDGDGVELTGGCSGACQGFPDNGNDVAEVLAAGELRNHAAVEGMEVNLAGDNRGEGLSAVPDHGGRCLVTGGLNAEDEAGGHLSMVAGELERRGRRGIEQVWFRWRRVRSSERRWT